MICSLKAEEKYLKVAEQNSFQNTLNEIMSMNKASAFGWFANQIKLFSKFGTIGLTAALADIAIFNLLVGLLGTPPVQGKIISGVVSTLLAWAGNRYWTFRDQRRERKIYEIIEYFIVAVGGIIITLICLWLSHYVLGFTSLIADNISGNVVGLALATGFRFYGNQYWVFNSNRKHHHTKARQAQI